MLALLAYALAYYWRSKSSVLQFQGNRVESREPPQKVQWWQAGFVCRLEQLGLPIDENQ
ncbi:hypothetical protein ACU5P0_12705 [Pseudomonas plecoglossicida]|uniref:hypothetical protein n=1 Tax=Pseudomonas plecoglossicida TaxID=70775 RepID=UPI00406BDAE2